MNGKIKSGGIFLAGALVGLALGAATTYRVLAQPQQTIMNDTFVASALHDTGTAALLRAGKSDVIVRSIDMNLPNTVLALHSLYPHHPNTPRALHNIKTYYHKYKLTIPEKIRPILNAVD